MSTRALLIRTLPRAFLSGADTGLTSIRQFRTVGVQVLHPVGISTRYQSFHPKKLDSKRHLNTQSGDPNKGSSARQGHPKPQWESKALFDLFVAEMEKQGQRSGNKMEDATLSKLREWASGEYFPPDLLKPVKEWSAQFEKLFSDLPTDQVTLLLGAFENTHREAWRLLIEKSQAQRRRVPRSVRYLDRTPKSKVYTDLTKVRIIERDARAARKAARVEVEKVNGTASTVMVTLRISNAIKMCAVFCQNPNKGEISHRLLKTNGKREGGELTAHIRKVMPRIDPALGSGSSGASDVYSCVLNCVRLMFPDLDITTTRQTIYPAEGSPTAGSMGPAAQGSGRGKRGFCQTLSTASSLSKNYFRKGDDDLASKKANQSGKSGDDSTSKIERNALYMFREFLRAKMNQELVDLPDSKNKD
ncbi:hypothetical protein V866_007179 [Kwoniella sp. B9012]